MDLGISLELHEGLTFLSATELAHAAESHGMRAVYAADHMVSMSGRAGAAALDPWMILSALAQSTSRVRLGSLVTPVTFRPPAVSAKLVATLDVISGGRAVIGLGLGWNKLEHRAYGIDFPARADRLTMLHEQLQILRFCWKTQPFTFRGRHHWMEDCRFSPRPCQSTGVPIIVGGMSRSSDLPELAVRYADGYALGKATPEQAGECRTRLDDLCDRAGRDPATMALSVVARFCIGQAARDVDTAHAILSRDVRPAASGTTTWLFGDRSEVCRQLSAYRRAGVDQLIVACEHPLHLAMLEILGDCAGLGG